MKKKLVALLMSVTMISGNMVLPVYAEDAETAIEFADDSGADAADLEMEEAEEQDEFNAEIPQEFSDAGEEDFSDHVDEELFSSEGEAAGESRASGGNINWGSSGSILSTDTQTSQEGSVLLGVKGNYITDTQAALNRINEIRKEACDEGVTDPRDENRKLTPSDYVPIRWSSDLEYIARIRAAEASLVIGHTRPNGTRCFTLKSPNGIQSWGEVLAWNGTRKFLPGIEQWYEEKSDWTGNTGGVTGHYTQMIDPDNLYVGLATFINTDAKYSTTTSGEYSSQKNLDETSGPDISDCTQTIEVKTADVTANMTDFGEELKVPGTVQAEFYATLSGHKLTVLDKVDWKSSDSSVATVDENGLVTGVQTGSADITATCKTLTATRTIKVKAEHHHSWDEGKVTKEATCTEDGVKTYTCTVCNETKTEPIKATGHQGELRGAVEATCKEEGYTGDTVCKVCGETLEKGTTIPKKEHSWDAGKVTKEATCTEDGVKTYTCTVCNETKTEPVKATGHQGELRGAVEATCSEEGYTGDTVCKVCGETLEKGTTIPKKEHNWDAGKVTKEATCTEDGVKTYTCTVCGETRTEPVKATGHQGELRGAVEATCKEEGYTGDTVCKVCGETLEKGNTIPKKEHSWDAGKVTKEATCTEDGVKTYTCTVCGETRTEPVKATGHQGELRGAVEATCSEEGYTGDTVCKVCGETLEKGTTIPKKDHSWDTGKVTKEATCTEDGVKTYTCTVCNETKTEPVKATGHQGELRGAVEATCKEEGYTGDTVCKVCGETLEKGTTIPKKDHSWDTGKVTKEATCTEDGVKTYTCTVCNETKTEPIKATGHQGELRGAVEATCSEEGYTGDTVCKVCGETLEKGSTIPKKDHSWDAGKVTKEATCTEDGVKTYTCTVCNETKTEPIKATGHQMGAWKTVTAATTRKEGKQERTCSACDYKETKSIPKLKTYTFKITVSKSAVTYNGKTQKPAVTVYAGNKKLSSKYYSVSYKNNKAVGTATITITGKGTYKNYTGKATFRINLQKTAVSSIKSTRKGQLQAVWKKTAGNTGYQVQYATNTKFSGAKTKNTTGTNYTFKGLKSKGKYYVRVRTYKKVGGKYWYSGWSSTKSIKIK